MNIKVILDWAGLALSLLNTIILLWLGLTVLLNAERRSLGLWLASWGLLAGAVFFLIHSTLLGLGVETLAWRFNFWWYTGWGLAIALPYAWYLLMLWFGGYWDDRNGELHRRQRPWLLGSLLYIGLLICLAVLTLPGLDVSSSQDALSVSLFPSGSTPWLILVYPPFSLGCIILALDVLRRPAPPSRVMGDLARRRARPWFMTTSLMLMLVSLLIGGFLLWLAVESQTVQSWLITSPDLAQVITWIDLASQSLILVAALSVGQAIVSYEIFTGKILPRRGFMRQWYATIALAAIISSIAAFALTRGVPAIYTALLLISLSTIAIVLINRRSFIERERNLLQLRPFITGSPLLEQILTPAQVADPQIDLTLPFRVLCQEVLSTRQAALIPLGSLAALIETPLRYPDTQIGDLPTLGNLMDRFHSPQQIGEQLDPAGFAGFIWASPLWSQRGLVGVLLLGEKADSGIYSLEEIELARLSGERMADLLASAALARRLITLQRQRLTESQILDRRASRVLHDDILPRLHTALLLLNSPAGISPENREEALALLTDLHHQISDLLHDLPAAQAPEVHRLGLVAALHSLVHKEMADSFDEVVWQADPEVEGHAKKLDPLTCEVAFFAAREVIRNASRHARIASTDHQLVLKIFLEWRDGLEVRIEDNGLGMSVSQTKTSAGGHGLALHSTLLAVIGGSLSIESAPGEFTCVTLHVPQEAKLPFATA
jgi:signal transduction histidine kinase